MTFRQRLEQIAHQKEQIRRQCVELESERMTALAALPAQFGYQDLPAFIRALRGSSGNGVGKPVKRRRNKPSSPASTKPEPQGLARAQVIPAQSPAPVEIGTSLDDPVNFGQMPDFSLLGNGQAVSQEDRSRLSGAYAFANRVLHTSRVPATVWREWRRFEKEAAARLRL